MSHLNFCETCNVATPFCRCPVVDYETRNKLVDLGQKLGLPTPPGRRKKPSRADKAHAKNIRPEELLPLPRVAARWVKTLTLTGHTDPFFSETVLSRVLSRADAKVVLAAVDALLTAVGEPRCP